MLSRQPDQNDRLRAAAENIISGDIALQAAVAVRVMGITVTCASTVGCDLRHFQQQIREPRRLIDHHVMAGIVVDEGLPTAGFAIGQRLVEGSLRIFRRADVGLLGDRVALAGELYRDDRSAVLARGPLAESVVGRNRPC